MENVDLMPKMRLFTGSDDRTRVLFTKKIRNNMHKKESLKKKHFTFSDGRTGLRLVTFDIS